MKSEVRGRLQSKAVLSFLVVLGSVVLVLQGYKNSVSSLSSLCCGLEVCLWQASQIPTTSVIAQPRLLTCIVSGWELPNLTIAIALDTHLVEACDALDPHWRGHRRCICCTEVACQTGVSA